MRAKIYLAVILKDDAILVVFLCAVSLARWFLGVLFGNGFVCQLVGRNDSFNPRNEFSTRASLSARYAEEWLHFEETDFVSQPEMPWCFFHWE